MEKWVLPTFIMIAAWPVYLKNWAPGINYLKLYFVVQEANNVTRL